MKISKKLIVGFLVVTLLGVAIGAVGIVNNMSMEGADTALYREDTLGLQYAGAAAVKFQQVRYNALKMVWLEVGAEDSIKATANDIAKFQKDLDGLFVQCGETITSKEILAYLNNLNGYWTKYQPMLGQLVDYKTRGDQVEVEKLVTPLAELGVTLRDGFLEMFNMVSAEAAAKSESNSAMANRSNIIMIAVIVVSIVLSVILGTYISRLIANPLAMVTKIAGLLAVGDIEVDSVINGDQTYLRKDELGKLSSAFMDLIASTREQVAATQKVAGGDLTTDVKVRSDNDALGKGLTSVVDNLNDLAVNIITASGQVASGANLVSDSSMALSQGATQQASAIEELTASLEEISSQTTLNAQNAERANALAVNAKKNAENGDTQMSEMLKAMDAINVSSSNINKIIKVIDDIAFQTNILALNAAVEAARAGQHGKGFAVVAEEVRTLAAKSANAAKETTAMIEGSIKNVEAGIKIANETAGALKKIVTEVSNAAELVGSIAVASNEQALGIEQLNQGIMQVSQVVQSNAATSEESAAASEELASQADKLKEVVSIFKVRQSNTYNAHEQAGTGEKKFENKARALPAGTGKPRISFDGDYGKY
jgi:methyl-accepting chemotaxis protein